MNKFICISKWFKLRIWKGLQPTKLSIESRLFVIEIVQLTFSQFVTNSYKAQLKDQKNTNVQAKCFFYLKLKNVL